MGKGKLYVFDQPRGYLWSTLFSSFLLIARAYLIGTAALVIVESTNVEWEKQSE